MKDRVTILLRAASSDLTAIETRAAFEAVKARYVGPNGALTILMKDLSAMPKGERPAAGKLINEAKIQLQGELEAVLSRIAPQTS